METRLIPSGRFRKPGGGGGAPGVGGGGGIGATGGAGGGTVAGVSGSGTTGTSTLDGNAEGRFPSPGCCKVNSPVDRRSAGTCRHKYVHTKHICTHIS